MSPEFSRFDETVTRLEASLRGHRSELEQVEADLRSNRAATEGHTKEIAAAKKVGKVGTVVGILGVVAALIGATLAIDGRQTAEDSQKIIATQTRDRADARIASCVQTNVYTEQNRQALVDGLLAIFPTPTVLNEQQQAAVDRYRESLEKSLPYRDCSPAGIDEYFQDPPVDPAIAEGTGS